jgi:hypothetical protein
MKSGAFYHSAKQNDGYPDPEREAVVTIASSKTHTHIMNLEGKKIDAFLTSILLD